MNTTLKAVALAIIILLPFFFSSCLNVEDVPERTAETEQQELNEAIASIEKAKYNVDTTKLGIYYITHKQGTGVFPQKGDTCKLIYTGFFLNRIIFDASIDHYKDSIWQLIYKEVSLIPGFDDGIALLNKGAEADIIIPSKLAYGSLGTPGIPPYTPILFSLKMKDVRPKVKQ
jgi:FKBP-type peptidyl-prolyl cis-trans isomerase